MKWHAAKGAAAEAGESNTKQESNQNTKTRFTALGAVVALFAAREEVNR